VKATAESNDLYVSVDGAIDKIKRQIKKYKSKIKDKDLPSDVEIASGALFSSDSGQIERRQLTVEKPMTPREAIIKLENNDQDFLIFMDSERNTISVARRKNDGNYEIIEPIY
jgi:putative sigma-54 modulation protein